MAATTKDILRNIHNQQQSNGYHNEHNVLQIVSILGGIDQILTNYFSESSNISIDQIQLSKLKQSLETSEQYQRNKSQSLTPINRTPSKDSIDHFHCYYNLDDKNTYLHSIFGVETAETLLKLIHSKVIKIIVVLSVILSLIMDTFLINNILLNLIYAFLMITILYPFGIWLILSVNKKGFKLILSSFEFWYKLSNGFIARIAMIILVHHTEQPSFFHLFSHISGLILMNIGIIYISSLDGYHMNNKCKIMFTSTMAIYFLIRIISAHYYSQNLHFIEVLFLPLSLESVLITAWTALTIFFWKQTVLSIIGYIFRNDKCVSIKCSASIKWSTKMETDDDKTHRNGTVCIPVADASNFSIQTPKKHKEDNNDTECIDGVPLTFPIQTKYENNDTDETSDRSDNIDDINDDN